jgi:hypothetical protein
MISSFGVAALVVLLSVACADGVAPPRGPLRLDADVQRVQLRVGDSTTVKFRLANVSAETLRLGFGSSCQIMPYVAQAPRLTVVHPAGGGWICSAVITSLTLEPGASRVVPLVLRAGTSTSFSDREVRLPRGQYYAYARLDNRTYPLQSRAVAIDVR